MKESGQIISTHDETVLQKEQECTRNLTPCNHEEADTRIFVHLADCVQKGHSRIMIRTVDTDVVVFAISAVGKVEVSEVWIAFGTGKNFKYLAVHEIARGLGPDRALSLPMFHAFTGCDTVSFFHGKGKKSAWLTWKAMEDITSTFLDLINNPSNVDKNMPAIERFVIVLYDRTSSELDVNHARKVMFAQKGRELERIPPTRDALMLHLQRAVYQASHIWHNMMVCEVATPSPSAWGWESGDGVECPWTPKWTTLPAVINTLAELLKCGCTKGCGSNCKWHKADLP